MSLHLEKWEEIRHSREYYGESIFDFFFLFLSLDVSSKRKMVQWIFFVPCESKKRSKRVNNRSVDGRMSIGNAATLTRESDR